MRSIQILLILLLTVSLSFGQKRGKGPRKGKGKITISGHVLDASTNSPIEYATVILKNKNSEDLIEGTTTGAQGEFILTSRTKDIIVEISFIGYETRAIDEFEFSRGKIDLGNVSLGSDAELMDEVIVTAEKSTTEFKLDKRVFNVGQDLSTTGASALEVLNNVPSVNVNIEGEISLRGSSGVQILINGKPSILADQQGNALGTITADMMSHVEVITNPSAKYEAEGTAGIINIVLKKNEKKGLNGSVTLNTGTPHNHSLGFSMNRRTEKLNLFTQLGVGYRELPRTNRNTNLDRVSGRELKSDGEEYRNEAFYKFILGSDYYVNPQNIITLSGSFSYEVEDQPSETNFVQSNDEGTILSEWRRTEVTEADNPKLQYELQYKRDFTDNKEHKLLFSAIGNYFGKEQSSDFTNELLSGSNTFNDQKTATTFKEGKYTFNLDYTKPIDEAWTIETGAQYLTNHVSNDYEVRDEVNGAFIIDPNLTNTFEYDQKVLGVYGTTAYEGTIWGAKLGLRAENTDLTTLLLNTDEENSQNFTNFFPSAHTSLKLTEAVSLQAGYSRRIYRPRLWDLNPFFNIRNNFNIRTGNPKLEPEYSDSYELGSIYIFDKISFNLTGYFRQTTQTIERVSTFVDGVTTFLPINIGTKDSGGLEFNFKYSPNKVLTLNGDVNISRFVREGTFNDQVFDFSGDRWSTKLTSKFKINKSLDFEITGRYQSEVVTVQGTSSGNMSTDLGLRYKLMKGRGVFNFAVRDVFSSRRRENIIDQDDFYVYSYGQRGRFVTLGFSYGFGKGEAMRFAGGRRH